MNSLVLLGDSMIDNGTYVNPGEPDVPVTPIQSRWRKTPSMLRVSRS